MLYCCVAVRCCTVALLCGAVLLSYCSSPVLELQHELLHHGLDCGVKQWVYTSVATKLCCSGALLCGAVLLRYCAVLYCCVTVRCCTVALLCGAVLLRYCAVLYCVTVVAPSSSYNTSCYNTGLIPSVVTLQ